MTIFRSGTVGTVLQNGVHCSRGGFAARGFTLLELMYTLAVFAIVIGVGVPSFIRIAQSSRVTTQTNELVSALNLARSEAIRRGAPATVEALDEDDGFAGGWCVYVGAVGCGDTDNVLRIYPAMTQMTVESAATSISFDARGARLSPATAELRLTLKPENCAADGTERARRLDIALTGRVNLARVACS